MPAVVLRNINYFCHRETTAALNSALNNCVIDNSVFFSFIDRDQCL